MWGVSCFSMYYFHFFLSFAIFLAFVTSSLLLFSTSSKFSHHDLARLPLALLCWVFASDTFFIVILYNILIKCPNHFNCPCSILSTNCSISNSFLTLSNLVIHIIRHRYFISIFCSGLFSLLVRTQILQPNVNIGEYAALYTIIFTLLQITATII